MAINSSCPAFVLILARSMTSEFLRVMDVAPRPPPSPAQDDVTEMQCLPGQWCRGEKWMWGGMWWSREIQNFPERKCRGRNVTQGETAWWCHFNSKWVTKLPRFGAGILKGFQISHQLLPNSEFDPFFSLGTSPHRKDRCCNHITWHSGAFKTRPVFPDSPRSTKVSSFPLTFELTFILHLHMAYLSLNRYKPSLRLELSSFVLYCIIVKVLFILGNFIYMYRNLWSYLPPFFLLSPPITPTLSLLTSHVFGFFPF